jgi:hypothetical protein
MFDDRAPGWNFLHDLGAIDDPEPARSADSGIFVVEVFSRLCFGVDERGFFSDGWRHRIIIRLAERRSKQSIGRLCETAQQSAIAFGVESVANWCSDLLRVERPRKSNQGQT